MYVIALLIKRADYYMFIKLQVDHSYNVVRNGFILIAHLFYLYKNNLKRGVAIDHCNKK